MNLKIITIMIAALMLPACALLTDHASPELNLSLTPEWSAEVDGNEITLGWLDVFKTEQLNEFVKLAVANNYNQQIALSRVNAAQSRLRIAGADRWPQINASLNASRSKRTFDIGSGVQQNLNNGFGLSIASISWEADVWGRISDQNKVALLNYEATALDYRAARMSLAANVAKQWFNALEAKLQVALAQETLENFNASLEIIQEGYLAGINQALDVHLARTNVANAESALNNQRIREDVIQRSLQLLAGVYPMDELPLAAALPEVGDAIPAGIPSDLLARRPDISAAQLRLQSSASSVDIAKKNRLPRISLTGSTGTSSDELENLLDMDYLIWSLAGNLSAPIFQGGRLKENQQLARYQNDEAFYSYANTVLNALVEVEGTLFAEPLLLNQERALTKATAESEAAAELANAQYASGLVDIITLLETQRRLSNSRSTLLSLRNQRLQNRIDLYLALAGEYLNEAHQGQLTE